MEGLGAAALRAFIAANHEQERPDYPHAQQINKHEIANAFYGRGRYGYEEQPRSYDGDARECFCAEPRLWLCCKEERKNPWPADQTKKKRKKWCSRQELLD